MPTLSGEKVSGGKGRLAQGELRPAVLVRLDDAIRRAGLALRQPARVGSQGGCFYSFGWPRRARLS